MKKSELQTSEYNVFYNTYINMIPNDMELIEGFYKGKKTIIDFFNSIPKDKLEYKYADNKWTIKEVFQHIIDTERIFMYRCLRIARHDSTALSGFDQNEYIEPSQANSKSIKSLKKEYKAVRRNSIILLNSLSAADLKFVGNASGNVMSARSAAFSTIGHEIWHMNIIKERYLKLLF